MRGLLRALAAQGRTVLVSSHLMDELERGADHPVIIACGRLLADVPLTDLAPRRGSLGDVYTRMVEDPAVHRSAAPSTPRGRLGRGADRRRARGGSR